MGSIDIIKLMSPVLSSAINKFQQRQEKNSWELILWLLGAKQECNPLCYVPNPAKSYFGNSCSSSGSGIVAQMIDPNDNIC